MIDPLETSHTAPKFASPDPAALAHWYKDILRFTGCVVFGEGDYAIVRRGKLCIHLWRCPDKYIADNTACYTQLGSIRALNTLHAEWLARTKDQEFSPGRIEASPKDSPGHGMREFHLWDPAGNVIGFGAPLHPHGAPAPDDQDH